MYVLVIYDAGAPGGLVVKPRNYVLRAISRVRAPSRVCVFLELKMTPYSA